MRRKARELAVQTMYALEFSGTEPELGPLGWLSHYREELDNLARNAGVETDSRIFTFADELLQSTLRHVGEIDEQLSSHATNWSFDRISPLDKSILRVGINELLFADTAAAIIINEAIEVSKKYSSENAGKFINGILNAVSKENDAK
ncbi:MAG: transcription antitermination factor NusB [Candidatus Cloacimonetes bacterium]|nr:transcription antitermination factor NusB [Candidatus Cloacimonadota bacterium]